MSGKGSNAVPEGAAGAPAAAAAAAAKNDEAAQRTKKGLARRRAPGGSGARAGNALAGGFAQPEPLPLTLQQADFVRVVKIETRKAAEAGEDMSHVQLSRTGKAAQLSLSEDRLSLTGTKGFRTARASHGTHAGTWYFEVRVARLGATGHARLGVVTRKAELQAPVGFDSFGYAYRDLEGSKVHQGRREPYGEAFGEGDVIGVLLHLPPGGKPLEAQDRKVVRFKGALYNLDEEERKPQPLPGSLLAFSRNGTPQGPAYRDILEGTYYPAAALYTLPEQTEGATVTFNFGPDFAHAPPALPEDAVAPGPARAWCELAAAQQQQQVAEGAAAGAGDVPAAAAAVGEGAQQPSAA